MTTKKVVAMATEEPPDGDTVRAQVDTGRLKHSDSGASPLDRSVVTAQRS